MTNSVAFITSGETGAASELSIIECVGEYLVEVENKYSQPGEKKFRVWITVEEVKD